MSYPFFEEHVDTAQLAYNKRAFKEGDICTITLKMHGTSGRTANTLQVIKKKRPSWLKKLFNIKDKETIAYSAVSGTRRVTLRNYDDGYYGNNAFRQHWHNFFADRLPKGIEIYYELVGWVNDKTPIMPPCKNSKVNDKEFKKQYGSQTVFSYGCEPGECKPYVYRMTYTNPDGVVFEIPWHQVKIECERMGVDCVPTLETFLFTTWDDLMERVEKYYDGADPIGKTHIREGVVVRIENREKFTAFKQKNFCFKVLEGIVKDEAEAPDMEEMQEIVNK